MLAFALWAYVGYDFSSVISAFAEADWRLILAGAILDIFLLYLRVFKWRFFHGAYRKISFYNMSLAAFAAYSFNMVVPARMGGLVQAWLLAKKESISKSTALGTVALIRIMDGITLAAIGLLVFFFIEVPEGKGAYWESLQKGGLIFTAFFFTITVILFALRKNRKFVEWFFSSAMFLAPTRFKPAVGKIIKLFWDGFAVLDQGRSLSIIVLLSFIFWGLVATSISIFLKAFGIAIVSVTMPFFILLAQIVGFLIPTPGYIGPFHAATVMALSFYGVSGELALSVAIIMHAMMFVTNTMLGFIYLWFENINLTTITREVKLDLLKTNYNSEK